MTSFRTQRLFFSLISVSCFVWLSNPVYAFQKKISQSFPHTKAIADLAQKQQWDHIEALIKHGPNSMPLNDQVQPDGMTALHWAAFHGNDSVVKQLLNQNFKVDATTLYKVTPLSIACEYGHAKVAKALLSGKDKPDLESKRIGGERPLMLAARNGNPELVKMLLDAGADVNAKEVKGQDALMWAAAAGNRESIKALIEGGADVNYKTKQDFSALMFAVRQGKMEAALCLLDLGYAVDKVMEPARTSGRNARKGTSALMLAVENGHFELALKLVERGADPNDQRSGYAPLHAISWVRRTSVGDNLAGDPAPRTTGSVNSLDFVRKLVKLGADVDLKCKYNGNKGKARLNRNGASPFLFAAKNADIPFMKLLLDLGANPKTFNADLATPLMAAAGIGVIAVGEEPGTEDEVEQALEMLLELGLDINHVDKNGETAMHGAAYRCYPTTVKFLAEHGADPKVWNKKNKHGWTPHMIANGKRPGSLKPSPETIAALDSVLQKISK